MNTTEYIMAIDKYNTHNNSAKKCTKNNNKTHNTKHSQGVAVERSVTGLTRLNLTPLRSVLSNFRHVGPPAVSLALPADRAASGTT